MVKTFWEKHKGKILGGLALAATVGVGGYLAHRHFNKPKPQQQSSAINNVSSGGGYFSNFRRPKPQQEFIPLIPTIIPKSQQKLIPFSNILSEEEKQVPIQDVISLQDHDLFKYQQPIVQNKQRKNDYNYTESKNRWKANMERRNFNLDEETQNQDNNQMMSQPYQSRQAQHGQRLNKLYDRGYTNITQQDLDDGSIQPIDRQLPMIYNSNRDKSNPHEKIHNQF